MGPNPNPQWVMNDTYVQCATLSFQLSRFSSWPKSPDKNIIILRTKKDFNDTHRERLVFHSIQYRNSWLAASDLFDSLHNQLKAHSKVWDNFC